MRKKRLLSVSCSIALPIILLLSLITVGCSAKLTPEQDSRRHFQKGLNQLTKRNMGKAIEEFKYALRLDPDFDQPYYYLGIAHQEIGDTEKALTYFEQYLKFKPEHLDTHLQIMRIFYLTGNIEKAIAKGDYLLTKLPDKTERQAEVHAFLGDIYLYKKKNMDAATFHFKQVLKRNPDSVETYLKLAEINQLNGDVEQAQKQLAKVITLDPNNAKAYNWLAEIYNQTQKDDELMELYKKISELKPKSLPPRINLANLYFKHKMYAEAKKTAQAVLELDSAEPTAHFILGQIYLLQENYQQAVYELAKARISKYKPTDTLLSLGAAYQKLMQWYEAIDAYESLVFIRPELFEAQFNLAKLYLRTKQWEKATTKTNELTTRFYGFEEAYLLQGFAHTQNGEFETALDELQNFFSPDKKLDEAGQRFYLKIYPNLMAPQRFKKTNPWYKTLGYYLMGICHLTKSDLNSALAEFNQAIATGTPFADPYFAKAIVYHIQGNLQQAINSCTPVLQVIKTDQSLAHLILANIYTSQGNLVAAQEHMLQAEGAIAEFSFSQMDITKNISQKDPLSLAQLNLGIIYLSYGWDKMAKSQCQLVLKANPHNSLANYIIEEMYMLTTKYYAKHNRFDDVLEKLLKYP
jgi:tetratricopeptide (TPR) repeat protein